MPTDVVTPPTDQDEFFARFGYYPDAIYCLSTGKRLGVLMIEEFDSVLDQLPPSEDVLADLRMRVLASMRPGMKWNRMRVDSLDVMRKRHPVETMAWLLNRLFTAPKDVKGLSWESEQENRIKLFAKIEIFKTQIMTDIPHSMWETVMLNLLDLHARFDLKNEVAPFTCDDLMAMPIESFMSDLLERLAPWHKRRVQFWNDSEARGDLMHNNPAARLAFLNTWLETKPQTEAQERRKDRQHTLNLFDGLFSEMMGDIKQESKPAAQRPTAAMMTKPDIAPTPKTNMPKMFGIAKKGN